MVIVLKAPNYAASKIFDKLIEEPFARGRTVKHLFFEWFLRTSHFESRKKPQRRFENLILI